MADEETPLPPQATGDTLPGQAADAADIAPAPTAESALLTANFGDKGAQQYNDLRQANQQASSPPTPTPTPAPVANLAGTTPSAPPAPPGGLSSGDLLGATLMGFASGDPNAGRKLAMERVQMAEAQQKMRAQTQALALHDLDFLEKLRTNNVPPDVRIAMIQEVAARQGQNLSPAQSAYIAHLTNDPNLMSHLMERIKTGDLEASQEFASLFSGDPTAMISAGDTIRKKHADADIAVANAEKANAQLPFVQREAEAGIREKEALAKAREMTAQNFYDTPERQAQAEAQEKGLQPGQPAFTNYINSRVGQLKSDLAVAASVAKMRADMAGKPLSGYLQKRVDEANDAYDIATDLMKLYNDPTIRGDRDALTQRATDILKYRLGVELPAGTDSLIALQSLLSITATTQFLHGMRNPQYIKDYIMSHMPQTIDPPERVITKLENMQRFSGRSIKNAYDLALSPAGQRQAEKERPTPALPGGGPDTTAAEPARPTTPEEAAALPAGTRFYKPDGKIYVR